MDDPPRGERADRGITLADCGLLILGIALVLALPWSDGLIDEPFMVGGGSGPVARWYAPIPFAHELLSKTSLALLPLVLWRCHREDRSARPAELLLAALGAWPLVEAVDALPAVANSWTSNQVPQSPFSWYPVPGVLFLWTRLGVASVAAVAILTLLIGRRRLPRLCVAALALVAMLMSYAWLKEPIIVGLDQPVIWHNVKAVAGPAVFLVRPAAMVALWLVPTTMLASAMFDFTLDRRGRRWTEWAGLGLSTPTLVLLAADVAYSGIIHPGFVTAEIPGIVAFLAGPPIVSGLLGVLLAWMIRRSRRNAAWRDHPD